MAEAEHCSISAYVMQKICLNIHRILRMTFLGYLSKIRHFVPFHTLVSIYNSLAVPYLRYGLIAWGQAGKTQLRGILCKIWDRVGHGTSPIWLKFCMQSCFGVLTTKWMFQSSVKFYFGSFDHGLFRSAPKGSQNSESKVFLSSFCPAYHNLLTKTINTTLKGHLSTHILCRILLWNKKIWSWTSEKL